MRLDPNAAPGSALTLSGIACRFADKDDPSQRYTAMRDVSLTVGAGEFVSGVDARAQADEWLKRVGLGVVERANAKYPRG